MFCNMEEWSFLGFFEKKIYFYMRKKSTKNITNKIRYKRQSKEKNKRITQTRCTRGDASSFFLYLQNIFVCIKKIY